MAVNSEINKDVYFSLLPCRKSERIYGLVDLLAIQICFGIAAWFFLVGSQTGMWLPARQAIPAIIFGNCFPLLLLGAMAVISSRYGVEQMAGTVPIFGQKYTIINIALFAITWLCALALAALMFGQSAVKLWGVMFGEHSLLATQWPGATIWAILALAIGFMFAARGPDTLKWFTRLAALFMMVVLCGFIIYLIFHVGIHNIFAAKPAAPIVVDGNAALSRRWNLASAFELNAGLGLSWAYFYGQFTRLAKSERIGYHGCMWGWGALAAVAGVFAAFAALAIGQYDPTAWLVVMSGNVGFPIIALLGLLLMATANISSVATIIYPAAITLVSKYPKLNWKLALIIATVPALILCTPGFYAKISSIYAIVGLVNAIYGIIVVTDYFFISRGVYKMRHIFNEKEGYQYWHGFNPAALIAMVSGLGFYLINLNPITWTSWTGWFPYISAGIPSTLVTGVIYYVLMKVWVLKKYPMPIAYQAPGSDEKQEAVA